MTEEMAKKNLEVIKAFAEGKKIQVRNKNNGKWQDSIEPMFYDGMEYRIKPEPEYVPWTVDNCPLKCGDVLLSKSSTKCAKLVTGINFEEGASLQIAVNGFWKDFNILLSTYIMADGTPCGRRVDK